MAATLLKQPALVRVPPRTTGERALASEPVFAVRTPGAADWSLVSLEAFPAVRAVTLLFDARDVLLTTVDLPPMSGARLARALPNLLEDALLQEPQNCAFALGPSNAGGPRPLAVIDASWLEFVVGAFERRGLRVRAAWPAQLTLPLTDHDWALDLRDDAIVLRTGPFSGSGWTAPDAGRAEALAAAWSAAARDAARPGRIVVLAPGPAWRADLDRAAGLTGMTVSPVDPVAPLPAPLDLLSARQGSARARWLAGVDWRAWRLPAGLLTASAAMWLLGLNLHWAQLARERAALRAGIEAVFRETFPSARVVVDPVLQMERQVADLRQAAGRSGPSDYLPLMLAFSRALGDGDAASDALRSVSYRDGRLRLQLRTARSGADARAQLVEACRRQGLALAFDGDGDDALLIVSPLS